MLIHFLELGTDESALASFGQTTSELLAFVRNVNSNYPVEKLTRFLRRNGFEETQLYLPTGIATSVWNCCIFEDSPANKKPRTASTNNCVARIDNGQYPAGFTVIQDRKGRRMPFANLDITDHDAPGDFTGVMGRFTSQGIIDHRTRKYMYLDGCGMGDIDEEDIRPGNDALIAHFYEMIRDEKYEYEMRLEECVVLIVKKP
jgi:hypothetical protein